MGFRHSELCIQFHISDWGAKFSGLTSSIVQFIRLLWINSHLIKSHLLSKELVLIDSCPLRQVPPGEGGPCSFMGTSKDLFGVVCPPGVFNLVWNNNHTFKTALAECTWFRFFPEWGKIVLLILACLVRGDVCPRRQELTGTPASPRMCLGE